MNITKIKIKNLFGIREYESDGSSVELSGRNGTGKTSVLDAIKYALTNRSDREYIVHNGETEGEIIVETDTGLTIDRKARINRTDYKSVKRNGLEIGSPETFLKEIFTPLQLNPIEFMDMDKKQQNAIILDMIEYPWNMETIREWFGEIPADVNYDQNILSVLNDIQAENGTYFQTRQDINRDIRAKRAIVTEIGSALPPDYDGERWENVNLSELYTKIEKIRKSNENIEKAKIIIKGHDNKIRSYQADREIALAALDREMEHLEREIETGIVAAKEQIKALGERKAELSERKADKAAVIESEYNEKVAKFEADVAAYTEYADMETQPVDSLVKEAETAEKMKSHINEWRRMLSLQEDISDLSKKSSSLTDKIEKARTLPGEILADCTIPIAGLTVENGVPLIHGLPVSNLSEGEKLDLCIDVALQKPNGLNIILIDGVEKLATDLRENLYRKCKEKGLQFIATRTTDDEYITAVEL